jgi:hypothetical protein
VTQDGQPVECFLTPGGFGDVLYRTLLLSHFVISS